MARKELNKPSSYWDKRRLKNFKANEKYTKEYIKRIKRIYAKSNKEVQDMIDNVYRNYSKDTGLDVQKLKEILSKSESEKTFKELKKQGLDKYVKNNYKSRISRLEQVQAQIYAKAKEIYPKEELEQTMAYKGVINNGYYKTIYDVEQNTGMQYAFSKIDDRMMNAVLSERWSGKNYSERIWTNTDILADNLSETISSALMSGQGVEKTAREIRERFNVAKYYSERLVRTEMVYFDNQADMMAYEELGVKEYVLVATLDNKTSEYCIEMDGQHFPYSKIVVGENYPPFHPNCRCTTRGYLGKEAEEMMERNAINPITGERELFAGNYKQWKESLKSRYGEDDVNIEYKKEKNKVKDKEQWKNYKEFIGKEHIPDTLEKWQELKYNKSSDYEFIKRYYVDMKRLGLPNNMSFDIYKTNMQAKKWEGWQAVGFYPKYVEGHMKHLEETGCKTFEEYERKAMKILNSKSRNIERVISNDGTHFAYKKKTNEFVCARSNGITQTYFKPEEGIEYWKREVVEKYEQRKN